jgi:hypothetical protein
MKMLLLLSLVTFCFSVSSPDISGGDKTSITFQKSNVQQKCFADNLVEEFEQEFSLPPIFQMGWSSPSGVIFSKISWSSQPFFTDPKDVLFYSDSSPPRLT